MENCIFCKIIAGEIPAAKIYEDDAVLAFLDINPVNIGHALVIPKRHFENLYDTPDELLAKMISAAKKISLAIKSAMHAGGINIEMNNERAAGQLVGHAHLHVVPRFENDGFTHWKGRRGYEEGEKETVADKLKEALK